jgi:hypothetical protein
MPTSTDIGRALLTLANDAACLRAVRHLEASGIPVIMLKGASIATWLYSGGVERPYADTDLLVSPRQWDRSLAVLRSLGFRVRGEHAHAFERSTSELDLSNDDGLFIDLHHRLALAAAEPADLCFRVLDQRTVPMPVGGGLVRVLDIPARAMHLALHAIQNGPRHTRSMEDLRRGLAAVPLEDWAEAWGIARAIGAELAFAAGLRCQPKGVEVATRLGLPSETTFGLRLRLENASPQASALDLFAQLPTWRDRLTWIYRKLVPTPALLAERYGLQAQQGRHRLAGLGRHWVHLLTTFLPSVRSWLRAVRQPTPGR